jgi:hypothetical protein
VAAVAGISAERLARTGAVRRSERALARLVPARIQPFGRPLLVAIATLGWAGVLTFVFLRNGRLTGTGGLAPAQLALYARTWFGPLAVVILVGLAGAVLAVVAAVVDRDRIRAGPVWDLTIATVCGLPLVLLVVAVGEPPRNYLAQIAIVAALAAAGWVWLGERLLELRRPVVTLPLGSLPAWVPG